MNCGNCARKVTDALQTVPGVTSVLPNVEARHVSVRWSTGVQPDVPATITALARAGYEAKLIETAGSTPKRHRNWQLNLWLGAVVTALLMVGEWAFNFGMVRWFQWIAFVLAGFVQVFCGAQFYRGAWRQLKVGRSDMDTLVALGSTTAFGYSAWALLTSQGGHVYFMEAAAIITLISIGHWIESRVGERASTALKSLMQLAPQTARRISSDSTRETEVPVAELNAGDLVALRPGDHVPTDGVVVEGNSMVDEAMLTGESMPVEKRVGANVFAGTINSNGRLIMRVTATGEATALAHIIAAVQRAQTSRANIQRLGDRVSSVFVPVVVVIALAAGLWWGFAPESAERIHNWLATFLWHAHLPTGTAAGFVIAAAVLIIACPCAMGLATPAAIMAAANAAAARGILIRDGIALEKAGKVTAVVFDKTGTLTLGKPEVVKSWQSGIGGEHEIAAALARNSAHPISQAIAKCSDEQIKLANWCEVPGGGVQGSIEHSTSNIQRPMVAAMLGSIRWLKESGVDISAGEKFLNEWLATGATVVGLALDSKLAALFAVRDTLKAGASKVVGQLQQQGLKTFLVTGDNTITATAIAKQIGIPTENVFAEVRPEQKAEFIKKLQAAGERVAFVGDGINDAPALTQADLGIAVSRASDVAREAADIVLLKSEIEAVPESLGLARATLQTIKQNLFWAFFYNALGVPLAALGFMSPVLCAAAMGFSDLIVIGNALRLRRWK